MDTYSFALDAEQSTLHIAVHDRKFDVGGVRVFRDALEEHWNDGIQKVTVDFAKVEFIDSSGVGALLVILKKLGPKTPPVRIVNAHNAVRDILVLLRLDKIFDIA